MAALYANDETKAAWSSSYITALPDSAFACIDSSGRHYPHHDASGKLDLPHLRNALSRLGQDDTTSCGASHLRAHAKSALGTKVEGPFMDHIKAERLTTTKWRVLAIPFVGRPKDGKDTDAEFFSPRTDIKADWFDRRPLIWHHGFDHTMKAAPELGTEDDLEMEDDGWWATAWLNRSHRYWNRIDKWLQEGKVFGSSGTLRHFAQKDHKTGEWLVWPHIEQTLTLTPANPFALIRPMKALEDFEIAGITVDDDMRPLFTEPDSEPDLEPDLPVEGGEAPATQLAAALDQYAEAIKERFGR